MKNLFVPYEIALKLKEKGFEPSCFASYEGNDDLCFRTVMSKNSYYISEEEDKYYCAAPLYQQCIDWFRKKHNIHVNADLLPNVKEYKGTFVPLDFTPKSFKSVIEYYNARIKYSTTDKFTNYYEALTAAIEEAIKLI